MKITKRIAPVGLAGVLGLAGLGIAAVGAPLAVAAGSAPTAEAGAGDASSDRLQAITDALADLVADGTITQDQADKVAAALAESDALRPGGPGGPGGHGGMVPLDLDVAADALGLTPEELRDALATEGTTLAEVAEEQGVETSTLVDALVAAGEERIEQAVTDGRLTREQADELRESLPERVAAAIELEFRGDRGHGSGRRGHLGDDDAGGPTDDGPTGQPDAAADVSPV
jgi:polyhydroxyalkanoate synthesis regulator phasin